MFKKTYGITSPLNFMRNNVDLGEMAGKEVKNGQLAEMVRSKQVISKLLAMIRFAY